MGEGQDTRDGVGLFFLFRDMVRRKPGEEMAVGGKSDSVG